MFQRISTGWELVKQSWQVLKLDKELLFFPLMSGIACLLVMASFAVPMWATGFVDTLAAQENANGEAVNRGTQILGVVILFAFYFVSYFVVIFFNSALIGCAIIRFKGGNPNLKDGFAAASARLPQIAGWAFVAASVGLILKLIESRSERVGQIVAGILGMAWSAVTYFVVPVIVIEKAGPIEAGKRSLSILKRTWGEALTANFSIGLIVFLLSMLGMLPLFGGAIALTAGNTILGVLGIVLGVLWILTISLVSSALQSIIVGALYLYASEGKIPQQFDDQIFRQAFAHK